MKLQKIVFVIFLLVFSTSLWGQVENKQDSISMDKNHPLTKSEELLLNDAMSDVKQIEKKDTISPEELKRRQLFLSSLRFVAPKGYVGPANESVSKDSLGRAFPYSKDYKFGNFHNLGNNIFLYTESSRNTYLGLGAMQAINANFNYSFLDKLSITGGVFGAKYNMPGISNEGLVGVQHFSDFGINASLRFDLHERIYLRALGQYTIGTGDKKGANINPLSGMMGLYPQTHFGGGLGILFTPNIGLEGGMVRELNPFTGKWNNRAYFMPVFKIGGR